LNTSTWSMTYRLSAQVLPPPAPIPPASNAGG
jgi:hypothetical protein